jgi:hypothetical protein
MARRNSKDVRYSAMTQRQLNRLIERKKRSDRRYDSKDWTERIFEKLNARKEETE